MVSEQQQYLERARAIVREQAERAGVQLSPTEVERIARVGKVNVASGVPGVEGKQLDRLNKSLQENTRARNFENKGKGITLRKVAVGAVATVGGVLLLNKLGINLWQWIETGLKKVPTGKMKEYAKSLFKLSTTTRGPGGGKAVEDVGGSV